MKKHFFFILVIILIIITFYNYYYEKFSVKVQDAMIFKDYEDNIVGTYPDRNIYPDLFVKAKGEYVNMIGTVHGVSEIKMPKPKDGSKGPKGERGPQGKRGPQGPRGKHGEELIKEDIENNHNSICIAPGGISVSRLCKGPDGNSPQKPPDGTPGKMCPHKGGKCPDGKNGKPGKTCMELIGSHKCPPGQPGPDGDSCAKVNSHLTITNNRCPDGEQGLPGQTCHQKFGHVDGICPIPADGNPGKTCYQKFGPLKPGGLPNCSASQPGIDSDDCMDEDYPNVKYCGRINPKKVHETANDLTINKFNGKELTIDNNKAIELNGNINLPNNGKIILRNQNDSILKEIDKQYIDNMILKSRQCKKCPSDHWNNSNNCETDQGTCIKCSECPNGYRTSTSCSDHNDAVFVQCGAGYVGKECHTKCDPKKGQYPNSNKSGCNTISSSQYITSDYRIHNIPSNKYRNPNDATSLLTCSGCPSGQYRSGCGGNTSGGSCYNNQCYCYNGTGTSGTSCPTRNSHVCSSCNSGYKKIGNKCEPYIRFYENYDYSGNYLEVTGESGWIGSSWNDKVSSIYNPGGHQFCVFEHSNYNGGCAHWYSSVPRLSDIPGGLYYPYNNTSTPVNDTISSYKVGKSCP